MSTLWSKGTQATDLVDDFTVGNDRVLDLRLAKYDVIGSKAHIKMLESIGLLEADELETLTKALDQILNEIEAGEFILEDDVEDIHSQVELLLTRRLGDIGKKIHSGRSRNDQVLVDVKLFLKDEVLKLREEVMTLFETLQKLSKKHKDTLLPGYTHGQVAMPSSFGLWFGAYAEALADDMYMLRGAYNVTDQNPLGSAAGYGSSFPLDRQMTTDLLGFASLDYNVVAAQLSRGKTERAVASAMGAISLTLNKFAADCCMYMSPNYGFIKFPDQLTTGSSIMPHKKNPDVWEIMRGNCNRIRKLIHMKEFYYYMMLVLMVLAAGCQREPFNNLSEVYASMEDVEDDLTKTYLSGTDICWSAGDRIAVFYKNTLRKRFDVTPESIDSKEATFMLDESYVQTGKNENISDNVAYSHSAM